MIGGLDLSLGQEWTEVDYLDMPVMVEFKVLEDSWLVLPFSSPFLTEDTL